MRRQMALSGGNSGPCGVILSVLYAGISDEGGQACFLKTEMKKTMIQIQFSTKKAVPGRIE